MSKEDFKNVKLQKLISVIVHGGNQLGFEIAKTLISQGAKVVIIDKFDSESRKLVQKLKKIGDADFIDFSGADEFFNVIGRIDYLFYLQGEYLQSEKDLDSKKFLNESTNLTNSLKAAGKYGAKVAMLTSVDLNRKLSQALFTGNSEKISPYSAEELQRYSETLAAEYHDKSKLDIRILRAGTILGHNFKKSHNPELYEMIEDSVLRNTIVIKGEGLNTHFLIDFEDAVYGLIKLTFEQGTNGEVVTLANNFEYTTLSIAYKLLELNPTATQIRFEESDQFFNPYQNSYTPAPNAESYNWKPKTQIEKTLYNLLNFFYREQNKKWQNQPSLDKAAPIDISKLKSSQTLSKPVKEKEKAHSSVVVKTPLGRALDVLLKPFKIGGGAVSTGVDKTKQLFNPANLSILAVSTLLFALLFYFLIYPLIAISVNGLFIYNSGKDLFNDLNTLKVDQSQQKLEEIEENILSIDSSLQKLKWSFDLTGQNELYQNTQNMLFGFQYTVSGAAQMVDVAAPLADYISEFEPAVNFSSDSANTTREYTEQLQELRNNRDKVDSAAYNISLGSNLIEQTDSTVFPKVAQPYLVELKQRNRELGQQIEPIRNVVKFLPEIMGLDARQRYVILLQNPSELRSTGGWLSSAGVISLERGQIRELKFDDIYNIEGLLRTQGKSYDAPQSMQSALGITKWSMSLSNWEPDFPTAAERAQFFMQEANNYSNIDGVIAIDVTFIQKLLNVWGSVEVPGEQQPVTADNLYEKIFSLHQEFTPGSTVKSVFLANLANEVFKKVLNSDNSEYAKIGSVVLDSLKSKNILLSFDNPDAAEYFDQENWNGEIEESYKALPFGIEWNWGANKANVFIDRNIDTSVQIVDENTLRYTYQVAIKNNSETEIYPEGDYINFERVYIPANAELISTSGFNDNVYKTRSENGYQIVEGFFNTLISSTQVLEIVYEIERNAADDTAYFPLTLSGANQVTLDLRAFKQAGTFTDRYKLEISFPSQWEVVEKSDLSRSGNIVSIQTDMETDLDYRIVWER